MTKKLTRSEELVRAAALRAAIVADLNARSAPVNQQEITESLKDTLVKWKVTDEATLRRVLARAVSAGLFTSEKDGTRVLYSLSKDSAEEKAQKTQKKLAKAQLKTLAIGAPDFTVDIVKATGRIRMTIAGLSIEIGVV